MRGLLSLRAASRRVLTDVLGARANERLVIITDLSDAVTIGMEIAKAAYEIGVRTLLISFSPEGDNPRMPEEIIASISSVDCIVLISKRSLTFSPDIVRAVKDGKRVASCPRVTKGMFIRALSVDLRALSNDTRNVAERLTMSSEALIASGHNSEAFFEIRSRRAVYVDGLAREPSTMTIVPGGIVGIAPVEGSSDGELIINGSISHLGLLRRPVKVTIEGGEIVDISGGHDAKRLERLLKSYEDKNMYKIAEIGVGVHPLMRIRGNATEDESSRGTIVVGLGENAGHLGGNIVASDHVDLFLKRGSMFLDGSPLVINGELLVGDLYEKDRGR
ncbi:MAG: hypothetical protein J7J75_01350 [Euryarchaeota archaeon]|nr:hypothetical protein [Euryarchaeota archaeon]MCD6158271.1 hypothetical protein [Euryarchaeota archaeon]